MGTVDSPVRGLAAEAGPMEGVEAFTLAYKVRAPRSDASVSCR